MNYKIILFFFLTITLLPTYGQEQSNISLALDTIEIPYDEFNRIARDAVITKLDQIHSVSWQATIDNKLVYANPDGNAIIRFYDTSQTEKFIEIGMGSNPDEKFWVAVQLPDLGYVVIHNKLERGWIPGATLTVAYTDRAGLTINNGERIVVSNLDVKGFAIGSYSVHGMEGSTDPPAINSGNMIVEIISGDPGENPIHFFPFFLAGIIGAIVATLLITKKRSS